MDKKLTNENLIDRLCFAGDDVSLDGKIIFSMPHRKTQSDISVLGIDESRSRGRMLYVGSGSCCHGYVALLLEYAVGESAPAFHLIDLRAPDLVVDDILPVVVDSKKTGFSDTSFGAFLVAGHGCSGAGVRLIDAYHPRMIDVVSTKEYHSDLPTHIGGPGPLPQLRIGSDGTISLGLHSRAYGEPLQRSFQTRSLNHKLNSIGVDIGKTLVANEGYARIHRNLGIVSDKK